jgi:hypothetical protein
LLLALIDTLIDIDVAYEHECKAVSQSSLGALAKSQRLKQLREQHQQRRLPLVQQLAAVQQQAWPEGSDAHAPVLLQSTLGSFVSL